ncbi:hypothetical protein GF312_15125 [Candidatus Poribacteria bacterium]|nr:hypothetical protein [Candidatus Poribacteria bacterium]
MLSFLRKQESSLYGNLLDYCFRRNGKLRGFSIITTLNPEEPVFLTNWLIMPSVYPLYRFSVSNRDFAKTTSFYRSSDKLAKGITS